LLKSNIECTEFLFVTTALSWKGNSIVEHGYISQKLNLAILLEEILYSVEPQMKNATPLVTDEDVPMTHKRTLSKKKYLLVLDDVWTLDLWDQLKIILHSMHNGSRVLITTRIRDVALAADPETAPYELHSLQEDESLVPLFRNAFQQHVQPNDPHRMK
jgi:NB-ARC domain